MRDKKEKIELSEELSKFYSTYIWPEDPLSEQGKQFFQMAKKYMESLINHDWIEEAVYF